MGPERIGRDRGRHPGRWAATIRGAAARAGQLRGAWGLADQGIASLGNYLSGVVLVQALSKQDFGTFFLVFGVLLLLNGLHAALITYPLSVRGAEGDAGHLRQRAGIAIADTLVLAIPLGGVVASAAILAQRPSLIPWALAAMLAWQVQETLRRALMAHLRHRDALPGDAVSYLGQALLLAGLGYAGLLSLETAFGAMAATSLLGALVQGWQLRPARPRAAAILDAARGDWRSCRWMLLTSAITLVTMQSMPWTLGYFHGLATVAEFGALSLVMGLANPVLIGMLGMIVPAVAASPDLAAARQVTLSHALSAAALLVPFLLAVLVVPGQALVIVTQQSAYSELGTHLRLFALGYALAFPAQVVQAMLNGLGRTRDGFVAQCCFSATTILVSLPMAAAFGLTGAVWAGLLPGLAFSVVAITLLRRMTPAADTAACVATCHPSPGCAATPVRTEAT
ncbi:MATE family efflux transporter [Falsiroseomonas oryzae]|uniref:polysaccharide biosynthesis C-terminal domain-containing protein n=1 Tax=Falsiroseomonas oryzae TaxID=2766473 RepID=UPI0022EAA6F9|nr:polysaccharide biosynthesis C-terminal domain-containing protein [Roseomonas sp. MO-31]